MCLKHSKLKNLPSVAYTQTSEKLAPFTLELLEEIFLKQSYISFSVIPQYLNLWMVLKLFPLKYIKCILEHRNCHGTKLPKAQQGSKLYCTVDSFSIK